MSKAASMASTRSAKEISFSRSRARNALMSMSTVTPLLLVVRWWALLGFGLAVELDLYAAVAQIGPRDLELGTVDVEQHPVVCDGDDASSALADARDAHLDEPC